MSTESAGNRATNENSPLVNGGASSAPHDVIRDGDDHGNDNDRISCSQNSSAMAFLFRLIVYPWHTAKVILLSNYANFLMFMVPLGIVSGKLGWNPTAVFTINLFAIVPLAAFLSFETEQFSIKLNKPFNTLLNTTFRIAMHLIVSIVALRRKDIELVQAFILGNILCNLLLVMGMCFLLGGIIHRGDSGNGREQVFSTTTAQSSCSLVALLLASGVIQVALYAVLDQSGSKEMAQSILILSRGTTIIFILLYFSYLVFTLRTHSNLFDPENHNEAGEDSESREPVIKPIAAIAVPCVTAVLVAVCADYLVDSIDDLVEIYGISRGFIGLILIPIVGNATKHVTAVVLTLRDRMDLAMDVVAGSSIQIALLVTPFLVFFGWIIGIEMTLHFDSFQTVAFIVSVLVATWIIQDGKSNYLKGAILIGLYIIIALAFYVTPSDAMFLNKSVCFTMSSAMKKFEF
ncbi:Ca2+:H+ antiporter [Fusarium proliferatum]|nr:Ca2+:H+ antiporter [Fusarium proliferatum]